MNITIINFWANLISVTAAIRDSPQKKTSLIAAIEQIAAMIDCSNIQVRGQIAWELLKTAKPLGSADYSAIIAKIAECISPGEPEALEAYRVSGWQINNNRLFVRADELKQPDFWGSLEKASKECIGIVIQGSKEDAFVPIGMIQQLVKEKPDPECFQRKIYCLLEEHFDQLEGIELPEFQVRAMFPNFVSHALEGVFQKTGTIEKPLKLGVSKDGLRQIKEYLEIFPHPDIFDQSGEDTAELLEMLIYAGHNGLYDQLEVELGMHRPGLSFKQDKERYSIQRAYWYANLYANTQQPQVRHQLEEYFSSMLFQLVFGWKRQLRPPGQKFISIEALNTGEKQPPREVGRRPEEVPTPELFEPILDIFRQIELSRIVIKGNGPKWFWEGLKTLVSLSEICFQQNSQLLNPDCQKALREMSQNPSCY